VAVLFVVWVTGGIIQTHDISSDHSMNSAPSAVLDADRVYLDSHRVFHVVGCN